MTGETSTTDRSPAVSSAALDWCRRGLWALCITVYLTVFVGGILAGAAELPTLLRAIGLTLATAILGRIALGLLAGATLPAEQGPSDTEHGPVGSLVDLVASSNVATQHDEAEAA